MFEIFSANAMLDSLKGVPKAMDNIGHPWPQYVFRPQTTPPKNVDPFSGDFGCPEF